MLFNLKENEVSTLVYALQTYFNECGEYSKEDVKLLKKLDPKNKYIDKEEIKEFEENALEE